MQQPEKSAEPNTLTEGIDYYLENGYWVLTEHFLRRRGYCCGSGCRHCPYKKKNMSAPQQEQTPKTIDLS
jgi:Family of unknown function (DUF5522)